MVIHLAFIVLDASTGRPAEGVEITLQVLDPSAGGDAAEVFQPVAKGYICSVPYQLDCII